MNTEHLEASRKRDLDDLLADMGCTHAAFVRAVEYLPRMPYSTRAVRNMEEKLVVAQVRG